IPQIRLTFFGGSVHHYHAYYSYAGERRLIRPYHEKLSVPGFEPSSGVFSARGFEASCARALSNVRSWGATGFSSLVAKCSDPYRTSRARLRAGYCAIVPVSVPISTGCNPSTQKEKGPGKPRALGLLLLGSRLYY